jgi:hypothetical protein
MSTFLTGRYNNETWSLSKEYRIKKNLACIYAPPLKISENIAYNSPIFVIEMNNDLNKVMGIGLIKNKLITDKIYKVQKDTNCNRYIYIGEYHISRELLNEYNPELIYLLDEILFKGYTHSKRGIGLTKLPEKILKIDICKNLDIKKEIKNIFIKHFKKETKKELIETK